MMSMLNSVRLVAVICLGVLYAGPAPAATWTNTYDVMDRLSGRIDPLGRSESYAYDLVGNLTRFTDRKGQVTTFTYDALNRLTGVAYADGSTTTMAYDIVGRLMFLDDSAGGRIDLAYDTLNRVVRETTAQGAIAYTYDAIGQRASMTVSGQIPVNYGYDAASRLTRVTQGTQTVVIAYDAAGRRASLTYPNGTTATYIATTRHLGSRALFIRKEQQVLNPFHTAMTRPAIGRRRCEAAIQLLFCLPHYRPPTMPRMNNFASITPRRTRPMIKMAI